MVMVEDFRVEKNPANLKYSANVYLHLNSAFNLDLNDFKKKKVLHLIELN